MILPLITVWLFKGFWLEAAYANLCFNRKCLIFRYVPITYIKRRVLMTKLIEKSVWVVFALLLSSSLIAQGHLTGFLYLWPVKYQKDDTVIY